MMNLYFTDGDDADELPLDAEFFADELGDPVRLEIDLEDLPATDPLADVTEVETEDVVFVEEKVTFEETPVLPPPPTPPPPQETIQANDKYSVYRNMTYAQFQAEMEKSIQDVVQESITLFSKDPREYHPFYLRIFKYLLIGKHLQFFSNESEHEIWEKYDKFAKARLELSKNRPRVPLAGEHSPYATYILTKKVIINGKMIVNQKMDEKERSRQYRRLDRVVKNIRKEWNANSGGGVIREDLRTRLKFFKECQTITFPSECIMVNNMWSKLLNDAGLKTVATVSVAEPPEKKLKLDVVRPQRTYGPAKGKKPILVKVIVQTPPTTPVPSAPPSPVVSLPQSPAYDEFLNEEDVMVTEQTSGENEKKQRSSVRVNKPDLVQKRKLLKGGHVPKSKKLDRKQNNNFTVRTIVRKKLQLVKSCLKRKSSNKQVITPLKAKLEKIIAKKLTLPVLTPSSLKGAKQTVEDKPEAKGSGVREPKKSIAEVQIGKDTNKFERVNSGTPTNAAQPQLTKTPSNEFKTESTDPPGNQTPAKPPKSRPSIPVVCDECGQVICHPSYMATHKSRMHHPDNPVFRCPDTSCLKTINNSRALWLHYTRNHIAPESICPEIGNLPPVARVETVGGGGPCEHCGKKFNNNANLSRHIRNTHGEGRFKENFVSCLHCPRKFKEKPTMMAHVRRFHEKTEVFRCDVCGKNCGSAGKVWKHKVDTHDVSPEEEATALGIKFEPCQFCGDRFVKGKNYRLHVEHEHPENFDEWWLSELNRRQERKREQRRLDGKRRAIRLAAQRLADKRAKQGIRVCPECQIEVGWDDWKKHLEEVHGASGESVVTKLNDKESWICPKEECKIELVDRRSLVIHLLGVHVNFEERVVNEKLVKFVGRSGVYFKYLCTLCGKHVFDREEVRVHIIAFHPEMFRCIKDGTPFPARIKPCPHCSSQFTEESELRSHVETCHEELCWRCPECSMVMLSPEDLTEHFMKDHSDGDNDDQQNLTGVVRTLNPDLHTFLPRRGRGPQSYPYSRKVKRDGNSESKRVKRRQETYAKYMVMKVPCAICKKLKSFHNMRNHLKTVHEIIEDGLLWVCPVCGGKPFKKRECWLSHMEISHEGEVNMQEMVEIAKEINTLADWRTMDLKTINRHGNRYKRQVQVLGAGETPVKKQYIKKGYAKVRRRKKAEQTVEKMVTRRSYAKRKNSRWNFRTRRTSQRRKTTLVGSITLPHEDIEVEKRLVIRVCRLAEDEILKWTCSKTE